MRYFTNLPKNFRNLTLYTYQGIQRRCWARCYLSRSLRVVPSLRLLCFFSAKLKCLLAYTV